MGSHQARFYDLLEDIVGHLRALPKPSPSAQRSASWMTSSDLLSKLGDRAAPLDAASLEEELCRHFQTHPESEIRPACYPGRTNCARLWGHVRRVGPGNRDRLCRWLKAEPLPLETIDIGEDRPLVFLSHAMADHHFAARVRLELARRYDVRSWLAEGELHEGADLFEGIREALHRSDALFLLLSSHSISSAWMYTETSSALAENKPIVALVDASDAAARLFVEKWLEGGRHASPMAWLDEPDIVPLRTAMRERFATAASPSRVRKFQKGLEDTLGSLTLSGHVAFYPDLPQDAIPQGTRAVLLRRRAEAAARCRTSIATKSLATR